MAFGFEYCSYNFIFKDAIEHPSKYLLRYNYPIIYYYGNKNMVEKLRKLSPNFRTNFFLMEKLRPLVTEVKKKNLLINFNKFFDFFCLKFWLPPPPPLLN